MFSFSVALHVHHSTTTGWLRVSYDRWDVMSCAYIMAFHCDSTINGKITTATSSVS